MDSLGIIRPTMKMLSPDAPADSSSKEHRPREGRLYDRAETTTDLERERRNPFLGILFTITSCTLLTLTAVIVKKLTYLDSSQISFVRNAGIFVGSLPTGIYSAGNVLGDRKDRTALLMGGFTGATSVYLYIMTYKYLPLLEATVILSTVPVVTTLAACIYLDETCSFGQTFCILLCVSGVLLSVRLPITGGEGFHTAEHDYLTGLPVAVVAVVTIAATLVILRHTKHVHFSVPMLYFSFIGMVENAAIHLVTSAFESPRCGLNLLLYMLVPVFGFAGNLTYVLALQVEAAGIVSILLTSEIVLSLVFQVIFFGQVPDVYNVTGACLVMASVSVLGFRKWLVAMPDGARIKEKFKIFLF